MVKRCARCGEFREATVEMFSRSRTTRDRLGSWCRPCRSEYNREYRRAHPDRDREYNRERRKRLAEIRELKAGMSCERCGAVEASTEMHWHHVDPATKSFRVSNAPSVEAAVAEIEKCILLCNPCHGRGHHPPGTPFLQSRSG